MARRLRGAVDAGQVPLCRLIRARLIPIRSSRPGPPSSSTTRPARSSLDCVRSVLADTSAGRGRARRGRQRLARRLGRRRSLAALPDVRVVRAPGNVGYARGANLGTAATKAPIVAVLNPDTVLEPGAGAIARDRLRSEPRLGGVRTAAAQSRRLRLSVGADLPVDPGCDRSRAARPLVAEESVHRPVPPARRRSRAAAARRLGVGRGDLVAPGRARRGRRLGRALLHVRRGHRSVLATTARGMGGRVRAVRGRGRTSRARARRAVRTACCSSIIARRGDSRRPVSPVRVRSCSRSPRSTSRCARCSRWVRTRGGRPRRHRSRRTPTASLRA